MAAKGERLQPVDIETELPKLSQVQQVYVKRVRRDNVLRAKGVTVIKKKNRYLGFFLASVSASAYAYTLYAIRQEGDDLPDTPIVQVAKAPDEQKT